MYVIITALNEEIRSYLAAGEFTKSDCEGPVYIYESKSRPHVVVLEGGIGRANAENATNHALRRFKPDFIVSAGFSGAVRPGYDAGHVVLCSTLMAMDGVPALWGPNAAHTTQAMDIDWTAKITGSLDGIDATYDQGACMTVSVFIPGSGLKNWIGENFPVNVIDMESYWVNKTAAAQGVPTVVLRSILDTADQSLPSFVSSEASIVDHRRWPRALKYLLRRPGEAWRLLGLWRQAKIADEALSRCLFRMESV